MNTYLITAGVPPKVAITQFWIKVSEFRRELTTAELIAAIIRLIRHYRCC